jgi:uncharacterized protein
VQLHELMTDPAEISAILKRYGVQEAAVFGSFSTGDATASSDLDLLVTYAPGTTLFDICQLQNELETLLGRKVDLVSRKSLSNRLAKRITSQTQLLPLAQ